MRKPIKRQKARFASGGAECAAWHYPGTNGACVIMTGGFGVTKEPGTDLFAQRFHEAGPAVRAAQRAPHGELVRLPGGHYQPFLAGHERAVAAELSLLRQHLLDHPTARRPAADSAVRAGGRP